MLDGTDVIIEVGLCLNICECYSFVPLQERYPKPFCFTIITPAKRFVLQAADEDEMAEWIEAIQHNLETIPNYEAADSDNVGADDD
jgi:hypothetical protein